MEKNIKTGGASETLRIGDGSDWHFVNGDWVDEKDNLLMVSRDVRARYDGYAHHYAFHRSLSHKDARVRFDFALNAHSDAGIILRATDESHFYLLHFPNAGQACRAQHFWAALSRMDGTGYLKHIKMEMVRRVPSNPGIWLPAELTLKRGKITVRVGENGFFEAEDDSIEGPGRIGVFCAGSAALRNVVVESEGGAGARWRDEVRQPVPWFYPCPDKTHGPAQMPHNLIRLPDGELLLRYDASEKMGHANPIPLLSRSRDGGRTWSKPEPLEVVREDGVWLGPLLHLTPGRRLIAVVGAKGGYVTAESADAGHTWSPPAPLDYGPLPPKMKERNLAPLLNLSDGSMLLFLYGRHSLLDPDLTVNNWGALHSKTFSARSTDDGRTWSPLMDLDNSAGQGIAGQNGNLDLTEVCAAQMSDGRIVALVRPIYSPWMWETWSADGGATWGPCMQGPFPGYATSNMLRTSSGAVLVAHRLPSMTVHCSRDDGRTWDQGTQIDASFWVMGSMVEVEPDVVLYVYWTQWMMRAQFIRVTPDGLEPVKPEELRRPR